CAREDYFYWYFDVW
nr:immunoglobulin heavy chain junction region [Mus musculus]